MIVICYLFSLIFYQHDTHNLISLSEFFSIATLLLSIRYGLLIDRKRIIWLILIVVGISLSIAINANDYNRYTLFLNTKHWMQLIIMILCFPTFIARLGKESINSIYKILFVGLIFQFSCYLLYVYDVGLFNYVFNTKSIAGLERFHYMTPNIFLLLVIFRRKKTLISSGLIVILLTLYFFITQSRQSLAVFLLLFFMHRIMPLFRFKRFVLSTLFLWFTWDFIFSAILKIGLSIGLDERHVYRISEIQNLLISKSFWVRGFDTLFVLNDIFLAPAFTIFFGKGLGKIYNIPRPGVSYGKIGEEVKVLDYMSEFVTHSPDFLISVLLIDGGIFLLVAFVFFLFREMNKIKESHSLKMFLLVFLIIILGSTHLVYNPIYLFIFLFLIYNQSGFKTTVFYG